MAVSVVLGAAAPVGADAGATGPATLLTTLARSEAAAARAERVARRAAERADRATWDAAALRADALADSRDLVVHLGPDQRARYLADAAIVRLDHHDRAARVARVARMLRRQADASEARAAHAYARWLDLVAVARALQPDTCPIDGPLSFVDSFGAPRGGGTRRHQGNDLMSPRGTDNVALTHGWLTRTDGGNGGHGALLRADDGDVYYYAHFESWIGTYPRRVATGEAIGLTGNTGDAEGGPTHTHFEYHPGGGPAVDPYRLLVKLCG
jgi:murein DD-endopeptidase MepM/ murein hydrolase activator NlpD